jgi:hypothetical protein
VTDQPFQPRRRVVHIRTPEGAEVQHDEIECRLCLGRGAKSSGEIEGVQQFEVVGSATVHYGRRGWLRRHGYEDRQLAPCEGCMGIGWVRITNTKEESV